MARYVLIVDPLSPAEDQSITAALNASGLNWWHWLNSTWIVIDPLGRGTSFWRDFVRKIAPKAGVLAIEGQGDWASLLGQQANDWLRENWVD